MLEIKKKGKFKTRFYGGQGYLSGDDRVKNWLENQQDKLLNPRYRELKRAASNEAELEKILSVFNVDSNGYPCIGNWMLLECSKTAQKLANTWGKYQVSGDRWKDSVIFSPDLVNLNNGQIVQNADGVDVYNVVPKGKTGFFKAYQHIEIGAEFEFSLFLPEDLCEKVEGRGKDKLFVADAVKSLACANEVLEKMQIIGLGAYRLRFGKFEYI